MTALQVQSKIEPSLTCLVWQKLQEQNPHFFHVYNYYLRLKDHATAFNYLVEQQALIHNELNAPGAASNSDVALVSGTSTSSNARKVVEIDVARP